MRSLWAQETGGLGAPRQTMGSLSCADSPTLEGSASRGWEDTGQGWGKVDAGLRAWQEDLETACLTSRLLPAILSMTDINTWPGLICKKTGLSALVDPTANIDNYIVFFLIWEE